ncbi:hypothetical protein IJ556_02695, partial [bacterium]|nr:hypothetical protein [bacterium]
MKNSKQPKILVLAALMLASAPFVAASPLAGVADSAAATFVNSAQAAAVNSVTSQAVRDISAAAAKDVRVNGITDCVMPPVKGLEPWRANLGDAIKIKIDTAAEKQFAERLNGISTNQPYTTTLPDGTTVIVPNPGPGGCVVPPVPNPGSDPRRHVGDLSARATENAAIARESIDA